MRRTFLSAALLLAIGASAFAAPVHTVVVRSAPEFTFLAAGDRAKPLKSLRGQPVVLLIADSPRTGAFRKQLKYLREIYSQFASRNVVFAAAFKDGNSEPVESDVPFALVNNGAAVASAYGVKEEFCIAIIGKDGNIDYQTPKVLTPQRIRDVIQNSFAVQAEARREIPR